MNVIDIFDIETSEWFKQPTTGASPGIRVNPCVTVFAAPDGSSFNVYLYGGQNLIPQGEQIQYDDLWILSIPSFNWIKVDLSNQSNPSARAGHTCEAKDGQMILIGGYNTTLSCDSPGIYVLNATSLQWTNNFVPVAAAPRTGNADPAMILEASNGYLVPDPVRKVIGGEATGGATVTTPVRAPTAGPFQTGTSPRWETIASGSRDTGPHVGVIVAGTIAGVLALIAGYLAFCFWLHRRQLKRYKEHMRMSHRSAFPSSPEASLGYAASGTSAGEKNGVHYGPFGTALDGSGAGERSSHAGSSIANHSPHNSIDAGEPKAGFASIIPGMPVAYGRLEDQDDDETTYHGAGPSQSKWGYASQARPLSTATANTLGSLATAHSSTDDLIKGQEMSFFQVVLNPRRTLRVVNSD